MHMSVHMHVGGYVHVRECMCVYAHARTRVCSIACESMCVCVCISVGLRFVVRSMMSVFNSDCRYFYPIIAVL